MARTSALASSYLMSPKVAIPVSYGQSSPLSDTICAMRKILLLTLMPAALAAAMDQNDVEFARPGGVSMTLDLHLPDGKGPFPAAIIVHGGSFSHGNKRTYVTPLFDVLSNAGFAWFTINYRLAPDYQFPAAVDDVQSAVIWVKSNAPKYRIDPKRVVLIGE